MRNNGKEQKPKQHKKGFTLVELIVVLVILGLLAALLVPALTGYIDKAKEKRVTASARQMKTALQTVAADFYNQNEGTWGNWNSGDTVYDGLTSATEGPKKLSRFISHAVSLSELNNIRNYQGSSGDDSFFAKLNKQGQIETLIYFEDGYYAVIKSSGEISSGKMEEGQTRRTIVEEILGYTLKTNYGGSTLDQNQSYVAL